MAVRLIVSFIRGNISRRKFRVFAKELTAAIECKYKVLFICLFIVYLFVELRVIGTRINQLKVQLIDVFISIQKKLTLYFNKHQMHLVFQ